MRKQNAEFATKFISEAGTQLLNSDYFAFVELDNLACYVLADGIDVANEPQCEAAKLAVNHIIAAFTESPSMKKSRIQSYLHGANAALKLNNRMWSLKASLTLVVTDYVKLRYAEIGNTRFRMYRNGYVHAESDDQSLSKMMVDEYTISKDKVAEHEERNNLYTYLGQQDGYYKPFVSKKIKLMDGDIISLYTRGIWEKVPDVDLDEVFTEAGDDPAKLLDQVEDLLFAPNPEDLDCYTIAAIFVNKVYIDPNRKKRMKKMITIGVIVLLVVIVATLLIFFWMRHRSRQRQEMNMAFTLAVEYMTDQNFVKASDELDTSYTLAKKLWDQEMQLKITNYQMLNEAIVSGHDALDAGKYEEAEEHFLTAQKRSRYADNLAQGLIEKRLMSTRNYINVQNYLSIGGSFFDNGDYARAIEQYEKARRLAASVNYADGREQALTALDQVAHAMEELNAQGQEQAVEERVAADLIIQGDTAAKEGDFTGATLYYTMAREKYETLENTEMVAGIDAKLQAATHKLDEYESKMQEAASYIVQGQYYQEQKDYWSAKQQYLLARSIYSSYKNDAKVEEVQQYITLMDSYLAQAESSSAAA